MILDELFMHRALYLASLGTGRVSPNPLVGCVIVQDKKIIGEGWHKEWGGPHAEVNAIDSVEDQSILRRATAYVNLEPCSHTGKTPPCTDLLIKKGIKKVIISNSDPNPQVNGRGIARLEEAGITVTQNVLSREGSQLNRRFFTFHKQNRPYIILKWAQTSDGFIARENYKSKWISNSYARKMVHKWRAEEDAVLVGKKTAAHDNPQLNVRMWYGNNPLRVVVDRFLKLSPALCLFDQTIPTVCYNLLEDRATHNLSFVRLEESTFISGLLADLHKKNIQSLIVEGGACMLTLFIEAGLWDEARVFFCPDCFEQGISAPAVNGCLIQERKVVDNTLKIYNNINPFPVGLREAGTNE